MNIIQYTEMLEGAELAKQAAEVDNVYYRQLMELAFGCLDMAEAVARGVRYINDRDPAWCEACARVRKATLALPIKYHFITMQ